MEFSALTESLYSVKISIPVLILAGYLVHSYLSYRRLSHIPGPWLAAWSNLWLVGIVLRKQSHLEFYELAEKYGIYCSDNISPTNIFRWNSTNLLYYSTGSIARIGPDVVITNDVELMRRISAARSPYVRSDWYRGMRFEPGVDHVFSMMDETAHTKRRAQMTNGVFPLVL
jgi:hypothetical protein